MFLKVFFGDLRYENLAGMSTWNPGGSECIII